VKVNSTHGLVQEQKATIVAFFFHEEDQARYNACAPGELFRPRFQPAGVWLQVDDYVTSPLSSAALRLVKNPEEDADAPPARPYFAPVVAWWRHKQQQRARGLLLYRPLEAEFSWRSSETHTVKRTGFALTHERFLTSTASQGQTVRTGVTIDCARIEPRGKQGASDDQWWLHLYVMFSRATCLEDMLLLRPPHRELLERGPPPHVQKALLSFEARIAESVEAAAALAAEMGIVVPES
jgi:hypothetical protein